MSAKPGQAHIGDQIVVQHIGSAVGFGMFAVCNGITLGIAEELIKPDQTKWTFDHYIVRPFNWNEKTSQWEEWHKPKDGKYLVTEKVSSFPQCDERYPACQAKEDSWVKAVREKVLEVINND